MQAYYNEDGLLGAVDLVTYQQMPADVGQLTTLPSTQIYVVSFEDTIVGAIVFLSDMGFYGLGSQRPSTAGIRFLAVRAGPGKTKSHCC